MTPCPGRLEGAIRRGLEMPCLLCERRLAWMAEISAGRVPEGMKPPSETPCPDFIPHKESQCPPQ